MRVSSSSGVQPTLTLLATVLLHTACDTRRPQGAPLANVDESASPVRQTGAICGRVYFTGTPPVTQPIDLTAYPACASRHEKGTLLVDDVVVNENRTMRNVFVRVSSGLEGEKFVPPTEPVLLGQKGCRFVPRVFGIQTRQKLRFLDEGGSVYHAPHFLRKGNPEGKPPRNPDEYRFTRSELTRIKSEIHPWMAAWCHVVDHPYFSVTDGDGEFHIAGLPPGEYVLTAWHEKYGEKKESVKVGSGESKEVDFHYNIE